MQDVYKPVNAILHDANDAQDDAKNAEGVNGNGDANQKFGKLKFKGVHLLRGIRIFHNIIIIARRN